jgi:hypothetical protein
MRTTKKAAIALLAITAVATAVLAGGGVTRDRGRGVVRGAVVGCAGLLLAVLALAACSSDEGSAAATPSPSLVLSPSPSVSLNPAGAAKREALAAYRNMWAAFVVASRTSNADDPDLRAYAQGQALRLIVNGLYSDRDQGKVGKGSLRLNPHVSSVTPAAHPSVVHVTDCVDDSNWLEYNKKTGHLWDNTPGGKHHTTATVKRAGGTWRVDSFYLKGVGTC